jgi:hypothetical protein
MSMVGEYINPEDVKGEEAEILAVDYLLGEKELEKLKHHFSYTNEEACRITKERENGACQ